MGQIVTAAFAAGVGQEVSANVRPAALLQGASPEMARVAASAAGASSAQVTSALASGKTLSEAIGAGVKGAAIAGGSEGLTQGAKTLYETTLAPPADDQTFIEIDQTPQSEEAERDEEVVGTLPPVEITTTPEEVDDTAFSSVPDIQRTQELPSDLPEEEVIYEEGKLPEEEVLFDEGQETKETRRLSKEAEDAIRFITRQGLRGLFSSQQTTRQPAQPSRGAEVSQVTYTGQGVSPGSAALAQALRTDAGDAVFGGEKKKGRRAGLNIESLRYMGDSGEA
jgi:hypothetical protein